MTPLPPRAARAIIAHVPTYQEPSDHDDPKEGQNYEHNLSSQIRRKEWCRDFRSGATQSNQFWTLASRLDWIVLRDERSAYGYVSVTTQKEKYQQDHLTKSSDCAKLTFITKENGPTVLKHLGPVAQERKIS